MTTWAQTISNSAVSVLQNRNKIRFSKILQDNDSSLAKCCICFLQAWPGQHSDEVQKGREENLQRLATFSHHQAGIHWTSKGKRGRPKETRTALHGTLTAGGRQEDIKRPGQHYTALWGQEEDRKTKRDQDSTARHSDGRRKTGRPKETRTALHGTLTAGGRQEDQKRPGQHSTALWRQEEDRKT